LVEVALAQDCAVVEIRHDHRWDAPHSCDGHITLEPKVIIGTISHLAVVEEATVLRTQGTRETADLPLSMAKRLQDGRRDLALRPSKPADPQLLAEYIVSGLPRIGHTKASTLLQRFGSVRGVFTAEVADIVAIHGCASAWKSRFFQVLCDQPKVEVPSESSLERSLVSTRRGIAI
jgi:ERCC4-type nuclease